MKQYKFEPYDVLQITRDFGATWEDYSTIRTDADAMSAEMYVWRSPYENVAFRIKRGAEVIFAKPSDRESFVKDPTVGDLRRIIALLPDDALIFPDWYQQPVECDPAVRIEGIRISEHEGSGRYLSVLVDLIDLEDKDEDDE